MSLSIKPDKPKVVLDTNIIVSALIAREGSSAQVFEKLLLGEIESYSSEEIISELREVFGREEIISRASFEARLFMLEHYLNNSIQAVPEQRVDASGHSSDNRFLEAALSANASYLITGDKHLLEIKQFRGIKIITAKEFLEKIKH